MGGADNINLCVNSEAKSVLRATDTVVSSDCTVDAELTPIEGNQTYKINCSTDATTV